jgi:hypothetical protein
VQDFGFSHSQLVGYLIPAAWGVHWCRAVIGLADICLHTAASQSLGKHFGAGRSRLVVLDDSWRFFPWDRLSANSFMGMR